MNRRTFFGALGVVGASAALGVPAVPAVAAPLGRVYQSDGVYNITLRISGVVGVTTMQVALKQALKRSDVLSVHADPRGGRVFINVESFET